MSGARKTRQRESDGGEGQLLMASRFVLYRIKFEKAGEEPAMIYLRSVHVLQLVTGEVCNPLNMAILLPNQIVSWEAGSCPAECLCALIATQPSKGMNIPFFPLSLSLSLCPLSPGRLPPGSHKQSGYKSASPPLRGEEHPPSPLFIPFIRIFA
ncbi:uncharacterized protein LY79DRAFT_336198 [Colletotrichum navitas]|uniref:Uncharacterized protein n=1 Tax=Colletotrichum navitas TaxID=681940 RepID=A0AAD8V1E5_9PEZI|nr:uncharacterized protein LY79DRAFT_336198 [Colletotrichum navitas]KAK1579667.1 hypothetical protein LY79DRAFT_336198 [Colletotrichum navitas]